MYWNFNSPDDSIEIGVHPLSPKKNNIKVPFDNGFNHPTLFTGGSNVLIIISFTVFIFFRKLIYLLSLVLITKH